MGQNIKKTLENPTGKFPANDKKTYTLIFNAICDEYELITPVDQMAANRMASTIMRIHYCEAKLKKYGLFTIEGDAITKMNPLAYYMRDLESEFMKYMRLLKKKTPEAIAPQSFLDLIDNGKTKPKKANK